jgi:hypothetical protein
MDELEAQITAEAKQVRPGCEWRRWVTVKL